MKKSRRNCLVLGVNGQDGSYVAEELLSQGHIVTGIGRQSQSKWIGDRDRFSYHSLDLADLGAFNALMNDTKPEWIFHLAAIHGSAGFSYEDHWADAHYVNTIATHAILEYLRRYMTEGVLVYPSSSKAFGLVPPAKTSEKSVRKSTCIYSTTKNASTDLIHYYRSRHGLRGSVVWTFNHDSSRREASFFIPQIVNILAHSILDRRHCGSVGSLQFWCDWGDAQEYMSILVDIAERGAGDDFILGTGTTVWAHDFVNELFSRYGYTASDHVKERASSPSTQRPEQWTADAMHLQTVLGRVPQHTAQQVCDDILRQNFPSAWAIARSSK